MSNTNTTETLEEVKVDAKEEAKIEAKHLKQAMNTGNKINKQQKVEIKIPVDPQNPKDLVVTVVINGYRWKIKRGEKVQVPKAVAKILEESKYI